MDPTFPAREVFRNFSAAAVVVFYFLAAVATAVFLYGFWLRIKKYRRGRPANRLNQLWSRIFKAGRTIGKHTTLKKRDSLAGNAHALIFWGFIALFIGTLIIMVDHDFLRPISPGLQFWKGTFYLWYSAILDIMGVGFLVGLGIMMLRRWRLRPAQLDYSRPDRKAAEYDRTGYVRDDQIFLWGLFWIGVTGFILEGLRIAADRPPFEIWSVVGWQIADFFDLVGFSPATANRLLFLPGGFTRSWLSALWPTSPIPRPSIYSWISLISSSTTRRRQNAFRLFQRGRHPWAIETLPILPGKNSWIWMRAPSAGAAMRRVRLEQRECRFPPGI